VPEDGVSRALLCLASSKALCQRDYEQGDAEEDIGELLAGAVDHDVAGVQFLDRPGRREAAGGHGAELFLPKSGGAVGPLTPSKPHFRQSAMACSKLPACFTVHIVRTDRRLGRRRRAQ